MPDWSWLGEDDEILNTFNGVQFIRCYAGANMERICALYTQQGMNKINPRYLYYGRIDTLDISTVWGSTSFSDIEIQSVHRMGERPKLEVIDTYDFHSENRLECKLVRNKQTNDKILYCLDEE